MSFVVKRPRVVEEDHLLAAAWYDEQQPGLGDTFLDGVESTVVSVQANPFLYSNRFADVRCVRLKRFKKYGVFYVIRGEEIRLLAIWHGGGNPRWLRERRRLLG